MLAAALKTKADVLVTDNVKHFPAERLAAFGLDVRTADAFIADTAMLDEGRAVPATADARGISAAPPDSRQTFAADGGSRPDGDG